MKLFNTFSRLCVSVFTIFTTIGPSSCILKILSIKVPDIVGSNTTVVLESAYTAEGTGLMSMKWYKNGDEFFRYVTNNTDRLSSLMAFNVSGLFMHPISKESQLEICGPTFCRISVDILDRNATGVYACEISSEPPDFLTHVAHQNLTVYDFPQFPPTLSRNKLQYVLGDELDIQCTSAPSYPACNMTLKFNGVDVDEQHKSIWDVRRQIDDTHIENRTISNMYLSMMLTRNLLKLLQRNTPINISCSCRLAGMTSTKEMLVLLRVPSQHYTELRKHIQTVEIPYASSNADGNQKMKKKIRALLEYFCIVFLLSLPFAN